MKQFMDILGVIISGGFLIFAFFYVVNFQAYLFSELFSETKPETSTKTTKQEIEEIKQRREKLQQEIEELRQKRLKLEEEHARIDSFGFHLHSKRKY